MICFTCLIFLSCTQSRAALPGLSYEVVPGQTSAAAAFMRGLVGASDYSTALGANFSNLLVSKYGLQAGVQTRRAFWINPAVAWSRASTAGTGRFSLSQVKWWPLWHAEFSVSSSLPYLQQWCTLVHLIPASAGC